MKIFEHKGRFLRIAFLAAALAVASLPAPKAAASNCLDECGAEQLACEAACPPLFSPGHFQCLRACRENYQACTLSCP